LAVIDGLGHGNEAADAADRARDSIASRPGDPLVQVMQRCHRVLVGMRGAAVTLVDVLNDGTLSWLAVGNVEAAVVRGGGDPTRRRVDAVLQQAGVVGMQLPGLHPRVLPFAGNDLLVLATDGIASSFLADVSATWPVQRTADWIVARHARANDDALALVARRAR
jgi:hypothetical protein